MSSSARGDVIAVAFSSLVTSGLAAQAEAASQSTTSSSVHSARLAGAILSHVAVIVQAPAANEQCLMLLLRADVQLSKRGSHSVSRAHASAYADVSVC